MLSDLNATLETLLQNGLKTLSQTATVQFGLPAGDLQSTSASAAIVSAFMYEIKLNKPLRGTPNQWSQPQAAEQAADSRKTLTPPVLLTPILCSYFITTWGRHHSG